MKRSAIRASLALRPPILLDSRKKPRGRSTCWGRRASVRLVTNELCASEHGGGGGVHKVAHGGAVTFTTPGRKIPSKTEFPLPARSLVVMGGACAR